MTRYCLHNLPPPNIPGAYELGLVRPSSRGVQRRHLSSAAVAVVYAGHTEDLRSRLQQYGQGGSHLQQQQQQIQAVNLTGREVNSELNGGGKGRGKAPEVVTRGTKCSSDNLFEDVFSCGLAIVFRWTQVCCWILVLDFLSLLTPACYPRITTAGTEWAMITASRTNFILPSHPLVSFLTLSFQASSKAHAANIESRLLSSYDYCWNRMANVSRRPLDGLTTTQRMPISRRVACIMPSTAGVMARLGGEERGTWMCHVGL